MIRKTARETVLYYNPEASSKVVKLKGVLVRMGIRIRNVTPEQFDETVGALAGISGFEKENQNKEQLVRNLQEQRQEPSQDQNQDQHPMIQDEVLVMHGFTSRRIDELLAAFRKAGVAKVELKAIVTETNAHWTFYHLYEEIKEEHERMTKGGANAEG
ncbi:DUF3783 domain-containing protein [Clostridium sp. OM02-18AC]|uniref:DUF3783 domain-containing protein n=1 Tax=Clostridium sp. OM02-18AC TaxID=2292311 RepID=UPI000E4E20FF|nr:DUF3783 domain-containing protein [Clostridium sp. OM02-18AC]RHV68003.1 DUF3783 domain-containing protein [Clostridium sp. OM02-18AC]